MNTRKFVRQLLGRWQKQALVEFVPILIQSLSDDNAGVRVSAAHSLGEIGVTGSTSLDQGLK